MRQCVILWLLVNQYETKGAMIVEPMNQYETKGAMIVEPMNQYEREGVLLVTATALTSARDALRTSRTPLFS